MAQHFLTSHPYVTAFKCQMSEVGSNATTFSQNKQVLKKCVPT